MIRIGNRDGPTMAGCRQPSIFGSGQQTKMTDWKPCRISASDCRKTKSVATRESTCDTHRCIPRHNQAEL